MRMRQTQRGVSCFSLLIVLGAASPTRAPAAPSPRPVLLAERRVDTDAAASNGWTRTDVRSGVEAIFAESGQAPGRGHTLPFLVQLAGTVSEADRTRLESAGVAVNAYLPEHTYLVRAAPAALVRVAAWDRVTWIGLWHPAYKWEAALANACAEHRAAAGSGAARIAVNVQTLGADDVDEIADLVAKAGGTLVNTARGLGWGLVRADIPVDLASVLAAQGSVVWIERYLAPKLFNDIAATGSRMNVTNVWATHGLTGANQIIGHADTGLDIGSTNGIHPDFEGRVIYAVGLARGILGRGGRWDDPDGHGTHTAGSILGSGAASGGQYRGIAWQAKLVHQSLIDKLGLLTGLPGNLSDLFGEAYTNGARIHSDSWGAAGAGRYDSDARQCDEFVWQWPEMLLVFAAGNEGIDADANGVIDPTSIGSPGSAKSVLCVGAAESGRPPGSGGYSSFAYGNLWPSDYPTAPISNDFASVSPGSAGQGLAAFSSRGPTEDGRIKPDIVAPGTDVISCHSRNPKAEYAWGTVAGNTNYMFSGGTSMATPLTAGAAALFRQYFTDVAGRTNPPPSAALVKAAMLNGARSLSPGQYGTGPTQEIPDGPRPNPAEGWGHVDVEGSLFPVAPSRLQAVDWDELSTGLTNLYTLAVTGTNRLSITLAYSDYPGFAGSARALVNDLDLLVIGPGGVTNRPFGAVTGDRLNNAESVDIPAPTPGLYRIRVEGVEVPEGPQPYALVTCGAAALTGTNQEVGLEQAVFPVSEADGTLAVTVARRRGITGEVRVDFSATPDTAASPADFVATNATLVFAPGVRSITVPIPIVNDGAVEGQERFTLTLSNPRGAVLAPVSQADVLVADDDGPGSLEFEFPAVLTGEGSVTAAVSVVRRQGISGTVGAQVNTSNGTAMAGTDYVATAGAVTFTNGVVQQWIHIPILDDTEVEEAESFGLRLSAPTGGATLGSLYTSVVVIAANDLTNRVFDESFDAGLPPGWTVLANGDPAAVWRFDNPAGRDNLTGGSNGFAIADSDFFGQVDMDTELRTPVIDVSRYETLTLEFKFDFLWWRLGGDEAVAIDVSTNAEAGPWFNLITASGTSLRGPRTPAFDVSAAAGAPSAMFRFHYKQAIGDWWWQVDDVRLSGRMRAGSATNQQIGLTETQVQVGESAGAVSIPVRRTGSSAGAVSVVYGTTPGSAVPGADYLPTNGVLTFANGATTADVSVVILNDTRTEPPLQFGVVLSSPSAPAILAGPTQAVVEVVDDDVVIYQRIQEDFSNGMPSGWTTSASGAPAAMWRFDDPGARSNLTGGAGGLAIADSAFFGDVAMDARLVTPPLNLGSFETVELVYRQDFNWYRLRQDEHADIAISTNGAGGPWTVVSSLSGESLRGPMATNLDLTPWTAGRTNVWVCFHYYDANGELWWQVDDVAVHGAVAGGNRDTDADGLEDSWEAFYFQDATNAVSGEDLDGDGRSNLDEQTAGTNPLDARDVLHIADVLPGNPPVIRFDTVSGRVYRIYTSTNLQSGWAAGPSLVGEGGEASVGPGGVASNGYYRVEVLPPWYPK